MIRDNSAEVKRLFDQLIDANLRVGAASFRSGAASPEVAEAKAAAEAIRNRIRAIDRPAP